MSIRCGNCHERHDSVDEVRQCHGHAPSNAGVAVGVGDYGGRIAQAQSPKGGGVTQAQLNYLRSLLDKRPAYRDVMNLWDEHLVKLTKAEASKLIETIKVECPNAEAAPEAPKSDEELAATVGVYVLPDGTIAQVKPNKAKTRLYAKRWVNINGERLTLSDEHVKGEWAYAPGLIKQCEEQYRMTLEQAKRFILVYGQCCRCGRKLKAAKSVEAGIGPVCIKYFGGALFAA